MPLISPDLWLCPEMGRTGRAEPGRGLRIAKNMPPLEGPKPLLLLELLPRAGKLCTMLVPVEQVRTIIGHRPRQRRHTIYIRACASPPLIMAADPRPTHRSLEPEALPRWTAT